MKKIAVLEQTTIDKIAAGEVVERPSSVVKELTENAIDAGASAITIEIKDGGISLIRITDNGSGIEKEQVPLAFLRHATSKIKQLDDLIHITSLGFRGEALSSIAAVSQMEVITKTSAEITGTHYVMEGGDEKLLEEVGAPTGTTFLVRNLFYNIPARSKFLKTAVTEAGYVSNYIEQLALSHSYISFKYIVNGQMKLHTSGNDNLKDVIYSIYGRELTKELKELHWKKDDFSLEGYIAKPTISRGNRNFENYYVNGRYVKNKVITKAIEDAYKPFMMQHKYPFTVLHLSVKGDTVDVNVHPAKMEVRFWQGDEVYETIYQAVTEALTKSEMIPEIKLETKEIQKESETAKPTKPAKPAKSEIPEPFENKRWEQIRETNAYKPDRSAPQIEKPPAVSQMELFDDKLLSKEAKARHIIIGQLFSTYWLVEYDSKFYIIDQHAAHEKVLYERIMKDLKKKEIDTQLLNPPMIAALNLQEDQLLKQHMDIFLSFGFEIEHFGGREYSIRAVPNNLYGIAKEELFIEVLDQLERENSNQPLDIITHKLAAMACKAAVKGNQSLSLTEADKLIEELLTLENPYHCPHGRPTIISMTKYELEKKFKRIV